MGKTTRLQSLKRSDSPGLSERVVFICGKMSQNMHFAARTNPLMFFTFFSIHEGL